MENTVGQPSQLSGLMSASREKYWSELTSDEKIERLRRELKKTVGRNSELSAEVAVLKTIFNQHSHDKFDRVLVPQDMVKSNYGGKDFGRLTDKTGDEVYL